MEQWTANLEFCPDKCTQIDETGGTKGSAALSNNPLVHTFP